MTRKEAWNLILAYATMDEDGNIINDFLRTEEAINLIQGILFPVENEPSAEDLIKRLFRDDEVND